MKPKLMPFCHVPEGEIFQVIRTGIRYVKMPGKVCCIGQCVCIDPIPLGPDRQQVGNAIVFRTGNFAIIDSQETCFVDRKTNSRF